MNNESRVSFEQKKSYASDNIRYLKVDSKNQSSVLLTPVSGEEQIHKPVEVLVVPDVVETKANNIRSS